MLLSLDSSWVPDKLASDGKGMQMKKEGMKSERSRILARRTKSYISDRWLLFMKDWICKPNDVDMVLVLGKTDMFGKGMGTRLY